ncbi:FAD-dependent oxidoreductase [Streptomyces sp. 891-h]|uniref:NAD(P)/FAD-dependent oxidoreductase n=1 Tax=unclassified Streptomyces TaxID=2593676 RepID=UPI001FAB0193|nr:FAD-dependent oxidoreductase [Streptomyces sp. 891-h]UNZ20999.1 FAD-dependent oxidoreductase [Streptomyces sp. 891-h]
MKHRIVVLGAGYAGAYVAGNLARRLSPEDTEITVVNADPDFVQRLRLHQFAAGQEIETPKLADVFGGTGIRLRVARVTALDPERRVVTVADAHGGGELGYDTLCYALGSHVADGGVPGVPEYAFDVTGRAAALRLRERLDSLDSGDGGGSVLVVGDGLTGIETATEIAESRPGLSVTLVARGELGARLSAGARGHLRLACDRLGITVVEHTGVEAVEATRVLCADGTALASDATVWAAGFAVAPIAAAGGLEVTDDGRIVVDRTMRSVSHPDVYAAGDAVHVIGDNGRPLPMSCASAGYTGKQVIAAVVGQLTGRKIPQIKLAYVGNHISLGRRDGILQPVDEEARAKPRYVGGRKAARIKSGILKGALWATSHPTFGLPKRRLRAAAAPDTSVGRSDGRPEAFAERADSPAQRQGSPDHRSDTPAEKSGPTAGRPESSAETAVA